MPDVALDAVIDDFARNAVYEAAESGNVAVPWTIARRKLVRMDLETGDTQTLATSTIPMQPCLSNDGSVVVFVATADTSNLPQVFVVDGEEQAARRLTSEAGGITEVVLSGNGNVAYAVTGAGRLLRIDVASGAVERIIGRTLMLTPPSSSTSHAIPGSNFTITGRGLATDAKWAVPPLPKELNGVQVLLNDEPVPLQSVTPTEVRFQIPWAAGPGKHRLEVKGEAASLFEAEAVVELEILRDAFPVFESLPGAYSAAGSLYVLAAHEGFSGVVTPEHPARPGETIHLYMSGLGPVEPAAETGAPSPSDPPARLLKPFSCSVGQNPAEVLFAGLAPGLTGYYQVNLRLPNVVDVLNGAAILACDFGNPGSIGTAWVPMAAQ